MFTTSVVNGACDAYSTIIIIIIKTQIYIDVTKYEHLIIQLITY